MGLRASQEVLFTSPVGWEVAPWLGNPRLPGQSLLAEAAGSAPCQGGRKVKSPVATRGTRGLPTFRWPCPSGCNPNHA